MSEPNNELNPTNSVIDQICDQLNSESVFHLSLHSKELFHSNVLGWFCDTYPDIAGRVFQNWVSHSENSIHKVQREKNNLDLAIQLPGLCPVVLENKVFSLPDESQLERYSDGKLANLSNPSLILLSLVSPNWNNSVFITDSGAQWTYISYRQLADALRDVTRLISGFDGDLLGKYVKFIDLLQQLVDEVSQIGEDRPISLDSSVRRSLEKVRLHSAIEKLRARAAISHVQRSMHQFSELDRVRFHSNLTNSQPLVEAFLRLDNGDELGWQYQGKSWRLAVRTDQHAGKGEKLKNLRFEYVARMYSDWFNFEEIPQIINRRVTKVPALEIKGTFNSYSPDFVYRHREFKDLTLTELLALNQHFIDRATTWLKGN